MAGQGLRKLQTNLVDRNRKDSLQLLRIQNDLNLLAVAMRDMVSSDEPYPSDRMVGAISSASGPILTTLCAWKRDSPPPAGLRSRAHF